jgi:putative transposase
MRTHTQGYDTDLSDAEWELLEPLVPKAKWGGRPEEYSKRAIVNAIRYVARTGCQWRMLPHDYPPWSTVYKYFRRWSDDGTWECIHDRLRGDVRVRAGRHRQPSAAIIDSQSVKTTEKGGLVATTRARKSRGESVICSST